jgi:hypothetical protein
VGFYGTTADFSQLPSQYRFIQDTASSVFNAGNTHYARFFTDKNYQGPSHVLGPRGGYTADLSDSSSGNMNDKLSSVRWNL